MTDKEKEGYAHYISRLSYLELGEEWDRVTTDILENAHKKKEEKERIVIEFPWKKTVHAPKKKMKLVVKKKKPSLKRKGKKNEKQHQVETPDRILSSNMGKSKSPGTKKRGRFRIHSSEHI